MEHLKKKKHGEENNVPSKKKKSSWEEKIFHGEKEVRTCEVLDKMSSTLHDL